jgi:prepilin-type N-terminal cleavage/methylation domain-containing protein
VSSQRVTRRHRRSRDQSGFTLVEALISLAILAVVSSVIVVVFSVGLRTILAPGASDSRLAASSNLMLLQELLSKDVERAACVATSPSNALGDCGSVLSRCESGGTWVGADQVCVGWPEITENGSPPSPAVSCQVVAYAVRVAGRVEREAWFGSSSSSDEILGSSQAAVSLAAVLQPGQPANPLGSLQVTLSSSVPSPAVLANPPTATFTLQPLATQPTGAGAAITAGGLPC